MITFSLFLKNKLKNEMIICTLSLCYLNILNIFPKMWPKPWTALSSWPASHMKNCKTSFFSDFQNSFQWPTGIGLEPHQNSFWKKIPTNAVARAVQNFGRNGPLLAGWLSNNKNFVVNLAQTCDEQMLKVSRRYLDSYSNYCKITDFIIWL